jgi:hypothetical protein
VGESPEARIERQRRMFEGEWREALHQDGRVYFYHTSTHETRWDAPPEGLYERRRVALMKHLEENPDQDPAKIAAGSSKEQSQHKLSTG